MALDMDTTFSRSSAGKTLDCIRLHMLYVEGEEEVKDAYLGTITNFTSQGSQISHFHLGSNLGGGFDQSSVSPHETCNFPHLSLTVAEKICSAPIALVSAPSLALLDVSRNHTRVSTWEKITTEVIC
jgi:hypothetical protein